MQCVFFKNQTQKPTILPSYAGNLEIVFVPQHGEKLDNRIKPIWNKESDIFLDHLLQNVVRPVQLWLIDPSGYCTVLPKDRLDLS